jgi:hypothetical protein
MLLHGVLPMMTFGATGPKLAPLIVSEVAPARVQSTVLLLAGAAIEAKQGRQMPARKQRLKRRASLVSMHPETEVSVGSEYETPGTDAENRRSFLSLQTLQTCKKPDI